MSDNSPRLYYFEDFDVGKDYESTSFSVEKEEVISFATIWDPQPFHIDEEAAKASHFGGLTACSAHIFSIYCHVAQNWEDGGVHVAIASLGFDEMRMLAPVFAGDTLFHTSTVEAVRESKSNPAAGIVMTRNLMRNQRDESVFSIKCAFLMQKRSALKS